MDEMKTLIEKGKKFKEFIETSSPEIKKFILEHKEHFKTILSNFGKEALAFCDAFRSEELAYDTVMKYFLQHKDDSNAIVKGGLLKEEVENGYIITQVFLDKNNNIINKNTGEPLGCKYIVKSLDTELIALFKKDDLVIVE